MIAVRFRGARGLSLVEVAITVGVISFCLIVLVGLLPGGLAAVRNGANEEAAADILSAVQTDISTSAGSGRFSPVYDVPPYRSTPQAVTKFCDAGGSILPAVEKARFRIDVIPHENGNPRIGVWHVAVGWPPQAATGRSSVETLVMVPRS